MENLTNFALTSLVNSIGSGDTTLVVASSTGFPAKPFRVTIGALPTVSNPNPHSEILLVTNVNGTTWTVTRAQEGTTSATTINSGAIICSSLTAKGLLNAIDRQGMQVYNVNSPTYGAVGDGTTDDSAAFQAALNDIIAAGGGILYAPAKRYRLNSQFVIPNEGTGPLYRQYPIKILGAGCNYGQPLSRSDNMYGGTVLDMRYAGGPKLLTLGAGELIIEGISFVDGGTENSNPFIYCTLTVLKISNCSFNGATGSAWRQQDAIVLGGTRDPDTMSPPGAYDGTVNDPFQGYGTVIEKCNFNCIRRAVWGRVFAGSIIIRECFINGQCGGDVTAAAIEFNGYSHPLECGGNSIMNNIFELGMYVYGVRFTNSSNNMCVGNKPADMMGITGAWSSAATYGSGHSVTYSNTLYYCILAVGPTETTPNNDASHWVKAVDPAQFSAWVSGHSYTPGDVVSSSGSAYVCYAATSSTDAPATTDRLLMTWRPLTPAMFYFSKGANANKVEDALGTALLYPLAIDTQGTNRINSTVQDVTKELVRNQLENSADFSYLTNSWTGTKAIIEGVSDGHQGKNYLLLTNTTSDATGMSVQIQVATVIGFTYQLVMWHKNGSQVEGHHSEGSFGISNEDSATGNSILDGGTMDDEGLWVQWKINFIATSPVTYINLHIYPQTDTYTTKYSEISCKQVF